MISLKKVLGQRLFLLGKIWSNKKKFLELHHEVLGDLSISRSPVLSLNKNTKSAETTIYTKLFTRQGHSGREDIN